MPQQTDWRYCRNCYGMFFDGLADKGRCAAGGRYLAWGYNFALPYGYSEKGTAQTAWRHCSKCHGLFYEGFAGNSSVKKGWCAAGGDHVPEGYIFALPHHLDSANVAFAQEGWRFCRECHGMFYDGYGKKGRCPASPVGPGKGQRPEHVAFGWNFILRKRQRNPSVRPLELTASRFGTG